MWVREGRKQREPNPSDWARSRACSVVQFALRGLLSRIGDCGILAWLVPCLVVEVLVGAVGVVVLVGAVVSWGRGWLLVSLVSCAEPRTGLFVP